MKLAMTLVGSMLVLSFGSPLPEEDDLLVIPEEQITKESPNIIGLLPTGATRLRRGTKKEESEVKPEATKGRERCGGRFMGGFGGFGGGFNPALGGFNPALGGVNPALGGFGNPNFAAFNPNFGFNPALAGGFPARNRRPTFLG